MSDNKDDNNDLAYEADDTISFSADIFNGYSFRGFVEQIATFNLNEVIFICHLYGIKLIATTTDNTFIVNCDIERQQLTKFVIGTDEKRILIKKIKSCKLLSILDSVTMKESFGLYKHSNDSNLYYRYLKDLSSNTMEGGVLESEILTEIPNFKGCNIKGYTDEMPNCVVPVCLIDDANKTYKGKNKNVNISFVFYDTWMRILSYDNNNVLKYNKEYGNNPNNTTNSMFSVTTLHQHDTNIIDTYKFNNKIILKGLGCFSKINPKGVILFYCEKDKPLRISSKLLYYGEINIYITKPKKQNI